MHFCHLCQQLEQQMSCHYCSSNWQPLYNNTLDSDYMGSAIAILQKCGAFPKSKLDKLVRKNAFFKKKSSLGFNIHMPV